MVTLATVGGGGQVTLPREVLEAAGIEPGGAVSFEVTGPATVQIKADHRATREQTSKEHRIDEPNGAETKRGSPEQSSPTETRAPRILTLEEMLERYRIEGPIDWERDREEWEDEAAKDIFGERPDRFPS